MKTSFYIQAEHTTRKISFNGSDSWSGSRFKENFSRRVCSASFTLIELLVVISIVALLSSVVLASLNTAREKGRIAAGQQFSSSVYHSAGSEAVGVWDMEDGTGATTIKDLSGNGNTGSLNGSTAWSTDTPYPSKKWSLSFNGSLGTDYAIVLYTPTILPSTSGFTWAAWIKPAQASLTTQTIFMSQGLPYFSILSSKLFFSVNAQGTQRSVGASTVLNADKWYFAVATYDSAGNMKIYLDGKLDGVGGLWPGLNPQTNSLNIGRHTGNNLYFTGNIASMRYYNGVALSAEEVQKLYAAEVATSKFAAEK